MKNNIIIIAIVVIFVAIIIVARNIIKTNRTINKIDKMITLAAEGDFKEEFFDESKLSALETKFANYLSASNISAINVAFERDKIKSLMTDISHQTKTPISNLLLYSELLSEQNLSDEADADVAEIREQAEKLSFLIDTLVKLSRLENGMIRLSPKLDSLQDMLYAVGKHYKERAMKKGLILIVENTDLFAYFDKKWTMEALDNIVSNAIKYTNVGCVTISAISYELFARIDVQDTGIGIQDEEMPKIFQRFYRGEQTKDVEGVGVGLYLARSIISSEGGYIKVSSNPGQGSTFSVFLPRNS